MEAAHQMSYIRTYQRLCAEWAKKCFGLSVTEDKMQRNYRFMEEALELAQSHGVTKEEVLQLVDYTFGRPLGDPLREVGGVMTTLSTMCHVYGYDLETCAYDELEYCEANIDKIREKWRNKPQMSPLSGSSA